MNEPYDHHVPVKAEAQFAWMRKPSIPSAPLLGVEGFFSYQCVSILRRLYTLFGRLIVLILRVL